MNVECDTRVRENRQEQPLHPQHRVFAGQPERQYYALIPPGAEGRSPLVLVHGISRNAAEMVSRFAPLAEQLRVPLIAPLFPKRDYGMYQQIADRRLGVRSDEALFDILDHVSEGWPIDIGSFALFGFSGGGQFAHRFALLHAERLTACIAASSGWYTWPDETIRWPRGLRRAPLPVAHDALANLPIHVVVGGCDTLSDGALRRSPRLDALQGTDRVERARRWHRAMKDSQLAPRCTITLLEGARHSFGSACRYGLVPHVFSVLGLHPASWG